MSQNDKLPVSSSPESSDGIDPPGFPAPFEDESRTPPAPVSEVPHVDLPATQALDTADSLNEPESPRHRQGQAFSTTEIQLALNLRSQGYTLRDIGKRLDRSAEGVRHILDEWEPTGALAKATLQKGALTLADRVIAQADVSQALEVLDRLDVLTKRDKGVDNRVQVILGINVDEAPRQIVTVSEEHS